MGFSFGRMVEFFSVLQNPTKKTFLRAGKTGFSPVLSCLTKFLTLFFNAIAVAMARTTWEEIPNV